MNAEILCVRSGGAQISPMLIEKLRHFAELGDLKEPILVTE